MTSEAEIKRINEELLLKYGRFHDYPKFRLVWSDSQIETRVGKVNVFYGSIFVRTEDGVHQLPKYPYIKSRWVLEVLAEGWNPELSKVINYEPLWTFQDINGNYLAPNLRAIHIIIYSVLNPTRLSPSDVDDQERKALEKEIEYFDDYLRGETSYVASMLANKEAIVVPGSTK